MIIAQLTDIHLGFPDANGRCLNQPRLETVLADIAGLQQKPDVILVTGDLTETGEQDDYTALKKIMASAPCPVYYLMGNHDKRENFIRAFSDAKGEDSFLHYVIEDFPLRIIALDTLERGRHGGAFCERRAAWLSARLDEAPDTPTLIALHHPPIYTGIDWLTAHDNEPWVQRLKSAVSGHKQIVQMIAGHIHRPIFKRFAGINLAVTPAVAAQVKMELAPINTEHLDERPLIVDSPPAYSLHSWDGRDLTTHMEMAPLSPAIIRFDQAGKKIIQHTMVDF